MIPCACIEVKVGKLRFAPEHLVDGLTFDERLRRLESRLFGNEHVDGLEGSHQLTRQRVEELESLERRRKMPWYVRLFVGRTR